MGRGDGSDEVGGVIQGRTELSLDAKGRLSVPARYRDMLGRLCEGRLTITAHPHGCLLVFPRPAWEAFRDGQVLAGTSSDTRRFYIGNAMDVELDGAGRVLVAPELRALAGIEKETILLGTGPRFELWDAATLKAREDAARRNALIEDM
jgi:MraZ protein